MRPGWDLREGWVDRGGGDVSSTLCSICCSFHPGGERASCSIAHTRRGEEQLCQAVWLGRLQSLPERVRACWGALQSCSQGLGNGPAWVAVLSSHSFSQGRGRAESSAPLSPRARAPSRACLGLGRWHSWLCSPQQLAVLPTSSLTPQRGPLNRHFHTPTKRGVMARRLLVVPRSCRGAKLQTGEDGRPPASPQSHPCRAGSPSWDSWMSTARLKAATDGQSRCAP